MPYDPRPVTDGGNRSIDIWFSRTAPKGKFRVVWVDTFDGSDGLDQDFNDKASAVAHAVEKAGTMNKRYVYDDCGSCVFDAGTF